MMLGGDSGEIAEGWDITIITNPCVLPADSENDVGDDQEDNENGVHSVISNLEFELSRAFQAILDSGNPDQIERFLKLLINKELLILLIKDELGNGNGNGNGADCPCKFRIGIQGNAAPTDVIVTQEGQADTNLSGTINVSAEQCFTGSTRCNPNVDEFSIDFGSDGTTINFTQGRRTMISCENGTVARLQGTAQASGDLLSGDFNVSIELTVDPDTEIGTWDIFAQSFDGDTTFSTQFTAPISSRTFIGACSENVGPN